MRIIIPLLSCLLVSACTSNRATDTNTFSGTLNKEENRFYLSSNSGERVFLSAMPQLDYKDYLGQRLSVQGSSCISHIAGSNCLEPRQIILVANEERELVYDWQQIDLEDYFF